MASPLALVAVLAVLLTAVGSLVMVLAPAVSRRYGGFAVLLAGVAAGAGAVADLLPVAAGLGLVVVVAAFWLVDRGIPLNRRRPGWLVALGVVMLVGGTAATATVLLSSPNVQ